MIKHAVALLMVTAWSSQALAACEVDISAADTLAFNKKEIEVSRSCGDVTLSFTHTGKLAKTIMGHNWVLAAAADVQGLGMDGMSAGLESNYVPPGDARALAYTAVVGPGETASVTFSLAELTADEYVYFCSFPGHWAAMRGTFRISD